MGRILLRTYRAFSSRALDKLEIRGYADISLAHTMMMMNIDVQGIQLTKLSEKIGVSRQAVTNLVQSLEQKKFLTRSPDPSDKRAAIVSVTKIGWKLIKDIVEVKSEIEDEYRSIIGDQQMDQLRNSLTKLLETVEK